MNKLEKLKGILGKMEKALLAYSGGTDSAFLLKVAQEVLGPGLLAVTAVSESFPAEDLGPARGLARKNKVRHLVLRTNEISIPAYRGNAPDRCYHCKKAIFSRFRGLAKSRGITYLIDASNTDDLRDYRPGRRALEEAGVRSPLIEAGFSKKEIRRWSRRLGLSTWDKPAMACLASRIPYHSPITPEKLRRVAGAERVLKNAGLRQYRVRDHGEIARIEVGPKDAALLRGRLAQKIVKALKKLSYTYVALDLEGYRMGSLNEALKKGRG
jgi:pyridinium-3,5-biscarboxylic acid mononucleotide sulfurtransferase